MGQCAPQVRLPHTTTIAAATATTILVETDPEGWTPLDQIPRDWGGTMGKDESMGAPIYKGGNVMPSGKTGQ